MNTEGAANINGDVFQPKLRHRGDRRAELSRPATPAAGVLRPRQLLQLRRRDATGSTGGIRLYPRSRVLRVRAARGPAIGGSAGRPASVRCTSSTARRNALRPHRRYAARDVVRPVHRAGVGHVDGWQRRLECCPEGDRPTATPATITTAGSGSTVDSADGRSGRHVYRFHTTGTDPSLGPSSRTPTARAASPSTRRIGGRRRPPRVYGLGAMQMFTPLSAGSGDRVLRASTWPRSTRPRRQDPGAQVSGTRRHEPAVADLAVQIPTSSGWTSTPLSYSAKVGTSGSGPNAACNTNASGSTLSIRTSNGGTR